MGAQTSVERSRLLHEDMLEFYRSGIETAEWIPLWAIRNTGSEFTAHFSALVPDSEVQTSLDHTSWDLYMNDCEPGFDVDEETGGIEYYRFSPPRGCEPLVIPRDFHDIHPGAVEVAEEFRLFHNLYHDGHGSYFSTDESGSEEVVVRAHDDHIDCRRVYLLRYCGARSAHAAIYFQNIRYSEFSPSDLALQNHRSEVAEALLRCDIAVSDEHLISDRQKSSAILYGKRLMQGLDPGPAGGWVPPERREYESFVIGRSASGAEEVHSCNPLLLADFFGGNPDAPHYFTPVSFRREVLDRYVAHPEKYTVGSTGLACGRLWSIRMDVDNAHLIVVALGDLGRYLPYLEQKHFRVFNTVSEEGFSPSFLDRNFRNRPTRPQQPDTKFRDQFEYVQKAWVERFGWPLFRPLTDDDAHAYQSLHRLATDSQKEFDDQVAALQKVVVESINEPEVVGRIQDPPSDLKNRGSIGKLAALLSEVDSTSEHVQPMRALLGLQDLRGGVAHRKDTSNYARGLATLGIEGMNRVLGFDQVLRQVAGFLFYLEENVIDNPGIDLS
jgi:hypothetical protein